jgi:hypothetical protein
VPAMTSAVQRRPVSITRSRQGGAAFLPRLTGGCANTTATTRLRPIATTRLRPIATTCLRPIATFRLRPIVN